MGIFGLQHFHLQALKGTNFWYVKRKGIQTVTYMSAFLIPDKNLNKQERYNHINAHIQLAFNMLRAVISKKN
jgi:hypothetical protein